MPKPKRVIGGKSPAQALKQELVRAPRPKIEEIGINFIREAGGPKAFAKSIYTEFHEAEVGSMARQRLLAIVFQSLKHIPDENTLETLEDLDDLDLLAILQNDLKLLNMTGDDDDSPDEERGTEEEQGGDKVGVGEQAPDEAREEGPRGAGCPAIFDADPAAGDEDGPAEEDEEAADVRLGEKAATHFEIYQVM